MEPILAEYLSNLRELHEGLGQAVAGLPAAALDWSPGPEMNSIAVLLAHTAGSQRYWIGEVAGQEPMNRDRPAEFQTRGVAAADLLARLDAVLAHSEQVLERLSLAELLAARDSSHRERELTVAWALDHSLAHTATHLGHIQLTRQLWEQQYSPAPI